MSAPRRRSTLHGLDDVVLGVADDDVCAEGASPLELLAARRRDDRARSESAAQLERCERDASSDPPDQHPLALAYRGLGHQHAVRRLEHERERRALFERERFGEWVQLPRWDRLQLAVRPVRVLSDHRDLAVMEDPGVDTTRSPTANPRRRRREQRRLRSVRSQYARLGHGWQAFANPDVQMVETRGPQLDQDLSGTGLRIRDVLVPEDFGPPSS